MKIQFEAKMMELSAQNDKLTQQLDQVEDKFKERLPHSDRSFHLIVDTFCPPPPPSPPSVL